MSINLHPALSPYCGVHAYGFGNLLSEQARSRPHCISVIDGEHRYTYLQLNERVNRIAGLLRSKGVEKGDRILWLGQNSFRVMEVLLASARVGAILCPANWRSSAEEIKFLIDDFMPKIVFYQEAEIGEINREVRNKWHPDKNWICHDSWEDDSYEAQLANSNLELEFEPVETTTPLLAIYTAAFTGRPGAALLSHESLLFIAWQSSFSQCIDEDSGYLVSGPMFHVGVLMGTLANFMRGGRNAFVARVDAEEMLQNIQNERLTHAYIAAPTIEQMRQINKDGKYDVSSIFPDPQMSTYKTVMVMPTDAPANIKMSGYGQTELSGLAVQLLMGGTGAGRPLPFIEIKIADDEGNEVEWGNAGEIMARGPLVMCGYWNRPEENARRVVNGWHRTNDLGKRLEDGSIVFVGPKTTMIKTGVENVYPAEVEACIKSFAGVQDVCIIGVPDPKWDQNVKAIIIKKPDADFTGQDIIEHCRKMLASYKKPKIVEFVDSLPRTPIGFVDRAKCDELFGGGGYPQVGSK